MNFKLVPQLLAGLLGDFSAGQGLGTADLRQRIAELLRGEDAWMQIIRFISIRIQNSILKIRCVKNISGSSKDIIQRLQPTYHNITILVIYLEVVRLFRNLTN